jgi:hypothetical protein
MATIKTSKLRYGCFKVAMLYYINVDKTKMREGIRAIFSRFRRLSTKRCRCKYE